MMQADLDVCVLYVHMPGVGAREKEADEFVESYREHDAGYCHRLAVICNGKQANATTRSIFQTIPNTTFLHHDNSGWDIGAYQAGAAAIECDLMMFLGCSTLIRGGNWLKRFVEVFEQRGPGIYGAMANLRPKSVSIFPHIRTTGFCMPPQLMRKYPHRIINQQDRYPFEHGENSLTRFITKQKLPALMVTWGGEFALSELRLVKNGLHRGNQQDLIFWDRLCRPPFYPKR